MSGIGTGYDLSVSTFSPDGRVFQTDYAQKAIDNSGTVVGIKCKDGVVLGVEKTIVSKMLEKGSSRRTFAVDRHAGVAVAGIVADGRQVVNRACEESRSYKSFYGDAIPGQVLADRIASFVHVFNLYWYARPFGTSTLLAAYDDAGPQLYLIEPSGDCHRYFGTAIGKGRQGAKTEVERLKLGEITCEQGVTEVAKILHSAHDEEKPFELEVSWICDATDRVFQRVPEDILQAAEAAAKAALEESDMED
ncbi:g3645 [Coccomyxa viridis]|uniref:G3645 protein n=1 Tax=Coccomyxa viridis TaxID=1274662 RepID=A0ABP1FNB2_9CHLO